MSKQDDYRGDVIYDVWRRGGDPDRVDYDRTRDDFYDGLSSEESASREIRRQKPREPQITEEQFYQEQFPEDYSSQEDGNK